MITRIQGHNVIPSDGHWQVLNDGLFRDMMAEKDGATLRYLQPSTGRTVTKRFRAGSFVFHRPRTNTIFYGENDVIPLHIPESQPASILNEFDKTEIVALAEDAAGLL